MIEDEEIDADDVPNVDGAHIKRKKLMLILLPLLIVIGISATIFFVLNKKNSSDLGNFKVVQYNKDAPESISVFYDLPEFRASVKGKDGYHELRFQINMELASVEDLKIIEVLAPKLSDVVLAHTVELTTDELRGSVGLYWFKEELFYRLNLAAAPVKIKNISFSLFDLQK